MQNLVFRNDKGVIGLMLNTNMYFRLMYPRHLQEGEELFLACTASDKHFGLIISNRLVMNLSSGPANSTTFVFKQATEAQLKERNLSTKNIDWYFWDLETKYDIFDFSKDWDFS